MTKADFLQIDTILHLPENLKGGVVVIGNFDGVHRGHQAVLQAALDYAKKHKKPAIVYSFEPHPRTFFHKDKPVDRLTHAKEKAEIFKILGFDAVVFQDFNAAFAHLTADEFIETIIENNFAASCVVTGYNFHFGEKRQGDPQFLLEAGKKFGFEVLQIASFVDENREVISSSRIRKLLMKADVEQAAGLLNYRYRVHAEIIHGAKLGRTLGFPTANMALPPQTGLAYGVYAVKFRRQNGVIYDGVASFGRRPTVTGDGEALLETFLFDFDGDLYGEKAFVSFFSFLRAEEKFDGLEPLIAQMNRDKQEAIAVLAHMKPLSAIDKILSF